MKGRVLGVDMGGRRIGLAISDPLGHTAQGMDSIQNTGEADVIQQIRERVEAHEIVLVVMGLPLNMDGTRGPEAEAVVALAGRLEAALGIPVRTWDERLSSVQADRLLAEGKVRGKERKHLQDRLAAQIILQAYLDHASSGGEEGGRAEP